jgi:hypothetical protein
MVAILVITLTLCFLHLFYKRSGTFPTLQYVLLVALAFLAAIQNFKFFYLMFAPDLEKFPLIGIYLSQGMGIIQVPKDLKSCLESVGSEFDRFNLALGPLAVIWLSVKQVLELIPKRSVLKQGISNQSIP